MACICQYFVTARSRKSFANRNEFVGDSVSTDDVLNFAEDKDIQCMENVVVSAAELAASKAEIWVLKKNLSEAQISIENLENLVKTIIGKQNDLLSEMYEIKRQNGELQDECRMQRDYQAMERNSLMRELNDMKTVLGDRSKLLEETVRKNSELTDALQDANEKIYVMGMKFLKLKSARSKHASDRSSTCSEKSN